MQLRPSRAKTSRLLLLCAAIVALAIWVISLGSEAAFIGLLLAVLFGVPLLYLIVQMIAPLEWWELTPEGITSHALGKPVTTRWDDIEELAFWRYGRLGQKKIYIKTRSGRLQEQRDRMAARRAISQGGYHVVLPASQLSISAESYFDLLQRYWKEREARNELGGRVPALT